VPPDPQLSSRSLARLIEQVGKACYNLGYTPGLNPAQWAALRYFQETTTDQCTVTGFANFQGTTKGTASQTVAALVRKGYLKRVADKKDRRVHRLVLTPEGEAMIAQDPLQALADAVEKLEEQDRCALAINMERVLRELIRA
jgi:DNA-binding MarR family transcriptional regulator